MTRPSNPGPVPNGSTLLSEQKSRSCGPISAHIVDRAPGEVFWRSDHHRIVCALTDIPGTVQVDDGRAGPLQLLRGVLSFTPSGMSTRCILRAGRFIQILQNPETYDVIISDIVRGGAVDIASPTPVFNDPLVLQIVSAIANEIDGGFLDNILADALNTALAAQITRRFVEPSAITLAPANGLSRERLERVRDYIETHLDHRLTLTDLAGVACLSPYHFSRSFKRAVGVGLQRYVMQRRIERAKSLMRRTRRPLAAIAQHCGFIDQSHLRARPQIIESTFDRVTYGFTTRSVYHILWR
jgi:AraC family transcriptional regulator